MVDGFGWVMFCRLKILPWTKSFVVFIRQKVLTKMKVSYFLDTKRSAVKIKTVLLNLRLLNSKKIRSSHQRCSAKNRALKNFEKFTGKHLCRSLFSIKFYWVFLKLSQYLQTRDFKKRDLLLRLLRNFFWLFSIKAVWELLVVQYKKCDSVF